MKKVLSIAGSDCSGGAGIQADLKTITAHKMYGMSAVTALTVQNTTGVYGILDANKEFVKNQIECIFNDIVPDAVKIGMVSNSNIINGICEELDRYNAKNIVVDPVMVSTSGSNLMNSDARSSLIENLLPMAKIITPNIPEAEVLSNFKIASSEDMVKSAKIIYDMINTNVLIKGGHFAQDANDLLFDGNSVIWIKENKINNKNTHGTGCTLSSAIACNLADGNSIIDSVKNAKKYITGAIKANMDLGKGRGPLNHMYNLEIKE